MMELNRQRSERYLSQVRKTVEILRAGNRTTIELAQLLFCTNSGVRNYLRPLRNAGLLYVIGKVAYGAGPKSDLFSLDADHERVEACLRQLEATPNPASATLANTPSMKHLATRVKKPAGVHLTHAEPHVMVKPAPRKAPPRHWLDVALFGDGPAPSLVVQC